MALGVGHRTGDRVVCCRRAGRHQAVNPALHVGRGSGGHAGAPRPGPSQTVVNLLRNYVSSIQSESMANRAIQRLGLPGVDALALSSRIKAAATEAEYKITLEVTDKDPVLAQRLAQTVADLFVGDVQAFAARQDPLDRLTATILNGGSQPAGQTWPRKKLLALAGVGGGLALGLLLALALEWARVDLVRTPDEAEEWIGLPVVGSIPASAAPSRRFSIKNRC